MLYLSTQFAGIVLDTASSAVERMTTIFAGGAALIGLTLPMLLRPTAHREPSMLMSILPAKYPSFVYEIDRRAEAFISAPRRAFASSEKRRDGEARYLLFGRRALRLLWAMLHK